MLVSDTDEYSGILARAPPSAVPAQDSDQQRAASQPATTTTAAAADNQQQSAAAEAQVTVTLGPGPGLLGTVWAEGWRLHNILRVRDTALQCHAALSHCWLYPGLDHDMMDTGPM